MRCENKTFLQNDPGFLQEISSTAVEVGLGGQKAAGITLTPTTSCSLPGVIGHTLSKLLNTEFALPRIQKNRNVSAYL